MSEVTFSLVKAKREDVTGTEMAERKIEHQTGTDRLFPGAKYPHLISTHQWTPSSATR